MCEEFVRDGGKGSASAVACTCTASSVLLCSQQQVGSRVVPESAHLSAVSMQRCYVCSTPYAVFSDAVIKIPGACAAVCVACGVTTFLSLN